MKQYMGQNFRRTYVGHYATKSTTNFNQIKHINFNQINHQF
jgi:hypothetical protein